MRVVRTPEREDVLSRVADEISGIHSDRIARVAIDGVDGSGKTTFADELRAVINRPVIRASADSFHNPRIVRYRLGRDSPQGFFEDSYNYTLLFEVLLLPLSPGGSGRYRTETFDYRTDTPVKSPELIAEPTSILLFDGIFLHRPELRDMWDYSVFLDVSFNVSIPRCALRGEGNPDPTAMENRRYVEGQKIYMRTCEPKEQATIVINNNDLSEPYVVSNGGRACL